MLVRAKSDYADAMVLANILRTDVTAHRPLPADTELAQRIPVLTRAVQDTNVRSPAGRQPGRSYGSSWLRAPNVLMSGGVANR